MPVQGWFDTPIYFNKVQEPVLSIIQKEFDSVVLEFEKNNSFQYNTGWLPGTHKLSDINFKTNFLEAYKLDTFVNELSMHVNAYLRELGVPSDKIKEFKITHSWMTHFSPNEFAHVHDHGSVDISGVYYYKANGQLEGGSIQFDNPVDQIKTWYLSETTGRNQVAYPAEVGKIILFPGWLKHGVTVNRSDENRMSVSFNIVFKRY